MPFPILGNPKIAFFDSSGSPLVAGTLAVLDPADDTNKASYPTYDDAAVPQNANTNPIVLDSRGEPTGTNVGLWGLDGEDYKLVLKDSNGDTIWTTDDVLCPSQYIPGDVRLYNVKGDGATDDTAAMVTAIAAGVTLRVPENFNILVTGLTLTTSIIGAGRETSKITCTGEISITASDVLLQDLEISGSGMTGSYLVDVTGAINNTQFIRCKIGDITQTSTVLTEAYAVRLDCDQQKNTVFDGCLFKDIAKTTALDSAGTDGFAGAIYFFNNAAGSMTDASTGSIRNCTFDNITTTGNTSLTTSDADAIRFYGNGASETAESTNMNIVIENNTFLDVEKRAVKVSGCGGITINNSTIRAEKTNGMHMGIAVNWGRNVTVTNTHCLGDFDYIINPAGSDVHFDGIWHTEYGSSRLINITPIALTAPSFNTVNMSVRNCDFGNSARGLVRSANGSYTTSKLLLENLTFLADTSNVVSRQGWIALQKCNDVKIRNIKVHGTMPEEGVFKFTDSINIDIDGGSFIVPDHLYEYVGGTDLCNTGESHNLSMRNIICEIEEGSDDLARKMDFRVNDIYLHNIQFIDYFKSSIAGNLEYLLINDADNIHVDGLFVHTKTSGANAAVDKGIGISGTSSRVSVRNVRHTFEGASTGHAQFGEIQETIDDIHLAHWKMQDQACLNVIHGSSTVTNTLVDDMTCINATPVSSTGSPHASYTLRDNLAL